MLNIVHAMSNVNRLAMAISQTLGRQVGPGTKVSKALGHQVGRGMAVVEVLGH